MYFEGHIHQGRFLRCNTKVFLDLSNRFVQMNHLHTIKINYGRALASVRSQLYPRVIIMDLHR